MKILVVTQYFWPENFKINDLCRALTNRGHEVTVYTGLPNYPEGTFFKGYSYQGPYSESLDGIKILRVPLVPRGKGKGFKLAINYFSFFFFASIFASFKARGKFDQIFVYGASPITVAIPGIILRFIKRVPMVLWIQDLWPESLEATGTIKNKKVLALVNVLVNIIYKFTDRILITSEGFASRILKTGVPIDKIKYWPQWAEPIFSDVKKDFSLSDKNLPQSGFKLMFAGNIGSSQDFETLIQAANLLKNYKDIHFIILGEGMMKDWAMAEVQTLGLEETFHFLGRKPVETMPYYYSQADAMLVILKDTDLFSITVPAKLQSYMASGKPVLASLNGEGALIVEKWKAGLTCPAGRPDQLSETILNMSKLSTKEMDSFGQNALKCYLSDFEREKLISELEDEFSKLRR